MKRRVTSLLAAILGAAGCLWSAGCGDSGNDNGDARVAQCTMGESESCECPNGKTSARVCLPDGAYTECNCVNLSGACSTAGEESECDCPSGVKGTRVCMASGVFGACDCSQAEARCCGGRGSCIPAKAAPKEALGALGEDSCQAGQGLLCAPDEFIAGEIPARCHSVGNSEGRCLPDCLPDVAEQKDSLPRDTCARGHLCVPCFDPFKGFWTGACELFGDTGPKEAPVVFDKCCSSRGYCVPSDLVPSEFTSYLGEDTCETGQGLLCAPAAFVETANPNDVVLEACASIAGAEGRCLPDCLPEAVDQAVPLPQDVCDDGYACAPCFDPVTGEATDACTLPGDPGPSESPVVFARCCGDIAACVPKDEVPADYLSYLDENTCRANQGLLCVPDEFTGHAHYVPPTCRSLAGAEGRCLPDCLPDVMESPVALLQDTCKDRFVCAPCYDPVDGAKTGVCDLPDDTGPTEPPQVFDRCCGGMGSCIPDELVPEEKAGYLGEASCQPDQGLLCAPDAFIEDPSYVPEVCHSIGKGEGRCLPECLPDVADQIIDLPQDICSKHFVCAPCFNPVDGAKTEVCTFPGDPGPTHKPYVFPKCCGSLGTCIPASLLPSNVAGVMPQGCTDPKYVCAPNELVKGSGLTGCMADVTLLGVVISTSAGVCLPSCMVPTSVSGSVLQKSCLNGQLCIPCTSVDAIVPGGCNF